MTPIARPTVALAIILILLIIPIFTAPVAADCLASCDAQYTTCQSGCRNISDTKQADACVDGCFRGYEGCKKRCNTSSENFSLPGDTVTLRDAPYGTPQLFDDGGSSGKVIPVCVQPPILCASNADCTCSHCCAQFGTSTVCQPSC